MFLAVSYMIIISTKKKSLRIQPIPNPIFNNAKHNPALVSFIQILSLVLFVSIVIIPGMFVTNRGPNGFILGYLPLLLTGLLFIPSQLYASNAKLRRFVAKEIREVLGMDRRNQSVWATNIHQSV